VHGGDVQMNQKQRINNKCYKLSPWIFSLLFLLSTTVFADNTKEQAVTKILEITDYEDSTLALPSDVAVLDGKIYVVDGGNHRVVVFDMQGRYLFKFGGKGSENGQMNYPVGISASADNRVFVADSGNYRVQVFTARGHFQSAFKITDGKKNIRPVDLILHSRTGHIFLTGSNNHSLMEYSHTGKFLRKWGGNGMNQGEFRYPATINELNDGRIAVVDVLNSRVQVFNPDGSISMVVSEWGVLPGQLVRPKGVAIDKKGNFYISDSYMNLLQSFTETGDFIAVLGKKDKSSTLVTPVGLTIYKNKLFVVEMRAHRVSVYQLVN